MKIFTFISLFLIITFFSNAQSLINGSFENNTAVDCQYNLSNNSFNNYMSNVNAFSMNYQQLDIQTTDEYIIPQDGSWCVGLSCRSESDGYDAIALELSEPLVIGTEYELTYYTYYNGASSGSADLRIGTSLVNNDFGNEIDLVTCGSPDSWMYRSVEFTPTSNITYITVKIDISNPQAWYQVDNFVISPVPNPPVIMNQPVDRFDQCISSEIFYSISGLDIDSYQWQVRPYGASNWSNVIDDITYSGSQTDSLTVTVNNDLHNFDYRCIVSNANGSTNSNPAILTTDNTQPLTPTLPELTSECEVIVVAPTTTDVCAGVVTGTTTDPLTYAEEGTYSITWVFDDGNENTTTATQIVTIADISAPVADVTDLPAVNEECSAILVAPTATDNCNGSITATTTTVFPLTSNEIVTWTYTDAKGNVSTQTQEIVIEDVTAPVADVTDLPAVNEECSVTLVTPTATDNCNGSITATTTTVFPVTVSEIVTWTYTDLAGNVSTQTQEIVIEDVTAPVADVTDLPAVNEECSVTLVTPTATDNCNGSITATTTTVFPVTVSEIVTWTYTDLAGNVSTQTQEIVIEDVTAPVADVTDLPAVNEECSVTLVTPTATDNCNGSITATTTTVFPVTVSEIVTWTYTDLAGNVSTQTQEIVIEDVTAPIADLTDLPAVNEECSVTLVTPTATDNCDGSIVATTTTVFPVTVSEIVTWTYTDIAGNVSTQTQEVVIEDVTDPSITCPDNFIVMADDNTNTYTVQGIELDPLAVDDNCGVFNIFSNISDNASLNGEVFNLGNTTIIWTVEDVSGRLTTCSFDVIIDEFVSVEANLNSDMFKLYPNPSQGTFVLDYSSDYQGQVQVRIVDMSGRQVAFYEYCKSVKNMNRQIIIEDLSTGAYYVVIQTDDMTITKKLLRSDK